LTQKQQAWLTRRQAQYGVSDLEISGKQDMYAFARMAASGSAQTKDGTKLLNMAWQARQQRQEKGDTAEREVVSGGKAGGGGYEGQLSYGAMVSWHRGLNDAAIASAAHNYHAKGADGSPDATPPPAKEGGG
jgi:hypothetical protein